MSVMNCFVAADAAHVFTDAGCYDMRDVKLRGIANKVAPLTRYNAAIATTGLFGIQLMLDGFLMDKKFETLEELAGEWGGYTREAVRLFNQAMELSPAARAKMPTSWGQFEAILAGWSVTKDEPLAVLVRGYAKDGVPAFSPIELTRYRSPDHPFFEDHIFDPDNAAQSGLELMRAQRSIKFGVRDVESKPAPGSMIVEEKGFVVATGFCQHTKVDRNGIAMRVIERWNDEWEPISANG